MQKALTESLQKYLSNWHLACVKCLARLITGLIEAETVNLTRIVRNFPGDADL